MIGWVDPNVVKVGGLQSQGAKGEAVVGYCEPLATLDLEPSGFPRCLKGKKDGEQPNRSWNALQVFSSKQAWIWFRFNAHNV